MSKREGNIIQAALANKNDPFARYPAELIIRIFESLHPYDVWAKRIVCRRWNTVLSSLDLTRPALARLTDHDRADSALPLAECVPDSIAAEIRHAQSLRLGRPFSSMYFKDDLAINGTLWPHSPFELKGKHIAYLQGEPRESFAVVLRDLISGQTNTLYGEAREKIFGLTLTSELLGFVTNTGFLYTTSLADPHNACKSTRLPSSRVRCLAGDGPIVACLLYGDDEHTVVIHDSTSAKTTLFTLMSHDLPQSDTPTKPECLIVDSTNKTIDLLMLVNEELEERAGDWYRTMIAVQRLSFSGSVLKQSQCDKGQVWHDLGDDDSENNFSLEDQPQNGLTLSNVRPAGRKGMFHLKMAYDQAADMMYDSTEMTFTRVSTPRECDKPDFRSYAGTAAFWKDREYTFHTLRESHGGLSMMFPQPFNVSNNIEDERPEHVCGSYIIWFLPTDREPPSENWIDCRPNFTQVHDTFAACVLPEDGIVQVFCFDERVQMHASQATGLWSDDYEPDDAEWAKPREESDPKKYHSFRAFEGGNGKKNDNKGVPVWARTKWKMPSFGRSEA